MIGFRSTLRTYANRLVGPILLIAITFALFWKLTLSNQFTWLTDGDIAYQVVPWFQAQAREWQSGSFPLWDPYQWAGQPLLAQGQPGAAYPLNWVLFSLPLK